MATFVRFYDKEGQDNGNIIGSPLCGSPISVKAQAVCLTIGDSDVLSFHRLILEVTAGIEGGDFITQSFSTAVNDDQTTKTGETVEMDISSAIRAVADSYEYTEGATKYPRILFRVKAYDEYRLNGEMHTESNPVYLPGKDATPYEQNTLVMSGDNAGLHHTDGYIYYLALMGKYSDLERLFAGYTKNALDFCRKPKTSPQVVCVGETFAYTPSFVGNEGGTQIDNFKGYGFYNLPCGPTSTVQDITTEGEQTVGDVTLYAIPEEQYTEDRYEFRFINGLGVLDSFSCYALSNQKVKIESNSYALTAQENFGTFSRGIIRKGDDPETLELTSGPLDKDWADWFIHEFLKAEHVWVRIFTDDERTNSIWVRCNLEIDDTVKGVNRQKNDLVSIDFSCVLDINGSINHNLAV